MNEPRGVLGAISDQIIFDLIEDPSFRKYTCIAIPEWTLVNENGELIISGNWIGDEIPSHPNWMRFTKEEGNFVISVSARSFFLEIITLLFEVYNSRERNKENNLSNLLTEALLNLRNRWRSPGEPIVPREQMRLIGELIPVIETSSIVGKEAIESWDSDGRALHDITSDRWVIECKATSKSPESVWISDPAQLDHRIDKNIFLSVTRMNRDKDGKTFPEMINELLIGIQSEEDKRAIKVMLNTQGYSEELREKYTTKWIIHGTRYLPIDSSSPVLQCSIFDNRPSEVMKITYQLNTAEMNDIEIKDTLAD